MNNETEIKQLLLDYVTAEGAEREKLFRLIHPYLNAISAAIFKRLDINKYNTRLEDMEDWQSEMMLKYLEKIGKESNILKIRNVKNFLFTIGKNRLVDILKREINKKEVAVAMKQLLNKNEWGDDEEIDGYLEIPDNFWERVRNYRLLNIKSTNYGE